MRGRTSPVHRVVLVVVCLAVAVGRCRAGLTRVCTSDTLSQTQGICGPGLSNILRTLCGANGYNKRNGLPSAGASLLYKLAGSRDTGEVKSASDDVGLGSSSTAAEDGVLGASSAAFVPRRVALSLLRSRRTVYSVGVPSRQGIICECCVHRCIISELTEYCRGPSIALDSLV